MALCVRLECPCAPGKVFASAATLRAHARSQRHVAFTLREEVRELRAALAEQRRIEALESISRIDCEKCGTRKAVTVRLSKQGKKGGAGGKAVDVAHYECKECRTAWCDTNE